MKKKILISLLVVVVIFIGYVAYSILSTRNLSPKGSVSYNKNGLVVSVKYGRPFKKNRLIFGTEEQSALVPYDKYWRLGANEATEITFNKDVMFAGAAVKAGSYRMYTVPASAKKWTVVLNSELGKWGAWDADHTLDVVKVDVSPVSINETIEQFTIDFEEAQQGIIMNFKWDKTKVPVPIQ
jgi:hypothetical protein